MTQFGWVRKLDTSGDQDSVNKKGLIRSYIVEGYDPLTIINDPTSVQNTSGVSLPDFNSPFGAGGIGGATLEQYAVITTNVTGGGAKVSEVEARYSNDKRFRAAVAPVDRNTPGIVRDTFERAKLTFDIPYTVNVPTRVSGNPLELDDWQIRSRNIGHTIYRWVKTVTLQNFSTGMLSVIESQNDVLHFFLNKWWLFESGDAVPIEDEDGKYEVEYTWSSDPGTRTIGYSTTPPLASTVRFPTDRYDWDIDGRAKLSPAGGLYLRPPFHQLIPVFDGGTTRIPPRFEPFIPYLTDRDGWQSLPGLGDV